MPRFTFPAEWSRHDATWIAWPHHEPDWPGKLGPIPWVYAEIVRVLAQYERVEILCHDEQVRAECDEQLRAHGVDAERATAPRPHRSRLAARLGADLRPRRARDACSS